MKSNQLKKLGQISQVIPGAANGAYTADVAASTNPVYLLKGNNVDSEGNISTEGMEQAVLSSKNADRYILQEGDVVVMARGSAIRAGIVTKEVADKGVIASANFIIIRPNKDEIQGEVIVAYLNSVLGQQGLLGLSMGAVIQYIPTSNLKEMDIPVLVKAAQKRISDIFYASHEAYQATLALAEQQKRTANASILNMMMKVA